MSQQVPLSFRSHLLSLHLRHMLRILYPGRAALRVCCLWGFSTISNHEPNSHAPPTPLYVKVTLSCSPRLRHIYSIRPIWWGIAISWLSSNATRRLAIVAMWALWKTISATYSGYPPCGGVLASVGKHSQPWQRLWLGGVDVVECNRYGTMPVHG